MAKRPRKVVNEQMRAASKARADRLHDEISDLIKQAATPGGQTDSGGASPSPREFIQKRMAQLGGMPKPGSRATAKKSAPAKSRK